MAAIIRRFRCVHVPTGQVSRIRNRHVKRSDARWACAHLRACIALACRLRDVPFRPHHADAPRPNRAVRRKWMNHHEAAASGTGFVCQANREPVRASIAVEPLLPVAIPHTTARLARGIRAGRWVFATGQSGTDYVNGLAPEVVQAERPLNGESH